MSGRITIYFEGGVVVDVATDGPHDLTIVDWDEHPDAPDDIAPDGHPGPALRAYLQQCADSHNQPTIGYRQRPGDFPEVRHVE